MIAGSRTRNRATLRACSAFNRRPGARRGFAVGRLVALLGLLIQVAGSTVPSAQAAVPRTSALTDPVRQAGCNPRPRVEVRTTPQSETQLRVDVAAGAGTLSQIRVDQTAGAEVDIGGQAARTGTFTVPISPRAALVTFAVRRPAPGVAATVTLTVFDDCGPWQTFVGGGAGAWMPPVQPATGPTVTAVQPAGGTAAGGTTVTLTGTGFATAAGATTARFGTAAATNVACSSATTCTATAPAGIGPADVTVTVAGRASPLTQVARFFYVATIASISPNTGPLGGGTLVTLTGSGFSTQPSQVIVTFGGLPATDVACPSASTCTVRSPARPTDGVVDVLVYIGAVFPSVATPATRFGYGSAAPGAAPTLTSISPAHGAEAGGTSVTLTGTSFSTAVGETRVVFGDGPGTAITCGSATRCSVTSPPGAGVVDVRVSAGGSLSLPVVGGRFNYGATDPPTITRPSGDPIATEIVPRGGTTAGGTIVKIVGAHFDTVAGTTTVRFGGVMSPNVGCPTDLICYAVSPPGFGVVDLTVTVGGHTTATAQQMRFTYEALGVPTISSVSVAVGSEGGGTSLAVTGTGFSTVLGVTSFWFGGLPAGFSACQSATACTVVSPSGAGSVALQVANNGQGIPGVLAGGAAALAATDAAVAPASTAAFSYGTPPRIGSIDPRVSIGAGGIDVDINGSGFATTGTTVMFGPKPATNVRCDSTTHCRVTNPSGTDAVDVQLTVGGLASQVTQATRFKYPKSVTTPGAVTVSPTTGQIRDVSGATFQVGWSGLVPTGQDWVKMYAVGARDEDAIQSIPLNVDEDTGTRSFPMPLFPGLYEFRLFRLTNQRAATSPTVQVTIPITASPATLTTNATATVGWVAPNGYTYQPIARDWVGLYEAGAADGTFVSRIQLTTSSVDARFILPSRVGSYEFRLFQNDTAQSGQQILLGKTAPIAVAQAANACGDQTKEGVYVFDHFSFTGGCALFTADSPNVDGLALAPNSASSIKLVGTGWVANLFTGRSYGGSRYQVTTSSGDFAAVGVPHDDMESIQVTRSNCGNGTEDGVYVYGHFSFTGSCTRFTTDTASMIGTAVGVDTASSIKFVGIGWTAILFDHLDYDGIGTMFTSNYTDFTGTAIDHDRAASIRVSRSIPSGTPGGPNVGYRVVATSDNCGTDHTVPGVYIFSGINWTGNCSRFNASVVDLSGANAGGKAIKSISFVGLTETTATLFERENYSGKYASFVGNVGNLETTPLGNGNALSMQITKRRQWDDPANFGDAKNALDYGLYWFRCGACRYGLIPGQGGDPLEPKSDGTKAEPGQDDSYFSRFRKTIIYVHGNRPGDGRYARESWRSYDKSLDHAEGYRVDGPGGDVRNVGLFYWNQFADDEQYSIRIAATTGCALIICITDQGQGIPFNSEAKIWSSTDRLAHDMRWRKQHAASEGPDGYNYPCDGVFRPCDTGERPIPISVSMLFFNEYVGFMEKSGPLQQEVQLVGHSLGGQLVNAMSRWLGTRIYDGFENYPLLPQWMMPSRITLVDPYFTDSTCMCGREYLPTHLQWKVADDNSRWVQAPVHNGTGYQLAEYIRWMKTKGVVFEYYHFTDQVAPRHKLVADQMPYVRVRVDYIMSEPLPGVHQDNKSDMIRLYAWSHMEAPGWFLRSKLFPSPTEFTYSWLPPSGFSQTSGRVPSAAMATEDLRAIMNCAGDHPCYWWDYIGNNSVRTPSDDQFERKNR